MDLRIDAAVLLAAIIYVRLRRRTQARSRNDELLTVAIVVVFGVMIAPTEFGQALFRAATQVVSSINDMNL